MNNLLSKSLLINALGIALFIAVTTFTEKYYPIVNILFQH